MKPKKSRQSFLEIGHSMAGSWAVGLRIDFITPAERNLSPSWMFRSVSVIQAVTFSVPFDGSHAASIKLSPSLLICDFSRTALLESFACLEDSVKIVPLKE